jgi:hypothetical protein
MEVNKYTVLSNKWLTPFNKIVKEENITFIFSYENKEHYKVYAHYIEEAEKYDDIEKHEVDNPNYMNLLYKVETIEYDDKGSVIKKSEHNGFISKGDIESLRGKTYIIPNPELYRLSFLDDQSTVVERIDDKNLTATTSSGDVYKLSEQDGGVFIIENDGNKFSTITDFELKVITTLNGKSI